MRLTTRGRYAVTAMLDIALHCDEGPVSVQDIADRQSISSSYLEQIVGRLKRAALLASHRGPGGGYVISRDTADISISAIVSAVGEGVDATKCSGSANCQEGHVCLTHDLWVDLSSQIDDFLQGISLANLMQRECIRGVAARQQRLVSIESARIAATTIDS
ncbi:MAG: Rrf2 family transcriptional regulator [Gammaproteobacteria bacterium]|nr:Rrf2 family transcriptional regulator [Gammaproteobacteria bacterium]